MTENIFRQSATVKPCEDFMIFIICRYIAPLILVLLTACGATSDADNQVPSADGAAKVEAGESTEAGVRVLWWNNIRTDNWYGMYLSAGGKELRARSVEAKPVDVEWYYSPSDRSIITDANGNGRVADGDWRLNRVANEYQIFLYQLRGEIPFNACTLKNIYVRCDLDPNYRVYVAVNDKHKSYNDNGASYDLHMRNIER